jgi:hypothetical protein
MSNAMTQTALMKVHRHGAAEPPQPRELESGEEEHPGGLAVPAMAEGARLPMARQIGVVIIIAEMGVMLDVIVAKPHRGRHGVRQIGEDADPFIPDRLFEDGVVAGVMNDDEKGVIGEGPDPERHDQGEPPIAKAEMAEKARNRDLADDDAKRDEGRDRIMADEPRDLRVRREDRAPSRRMRPRRFGQKKAAWPSHGRARFEGAVISYVKTHQFVS